MQFSSLLVAAAAFALANAAAKFTNPSFNSVTAGKTFNITWEGASGPVTLTLKNGPTTALNTVSVIASMYCLRVQSSIFANIFCRRIVRWIIRMVCTSYPSSGHLRNPD